jgi:hypothetical protein
MCIILDKVNDVSSTKIASIHVGYSHDVNSKNSVNPAQLIVYSASVDSLADTNAFVLPVYNPDNNPEKIIPLDMSHMSDFFSDLKSIFDVWFGARAKGYSMDGMMMSSNSSRGHLVVHTVGDYKFSVMPHKRDFDRIDTSKLKVNPHAKISIDQHNDNYSFIICQFFKKGKINMSPFGYLCVPKTSDSMIIPTVHGHPHDDNFISGIDGVGYIPNIRLNYNTKIDFEDTSEYDHEIYALIKASEEECSKNPIKVNENDLGKINKLLGKIGKDYNDRKIRLYIPKNIIPKKIKITTVELNRNFIIKPTESHFIKDLECDRMMDERMNIRYD